MTAKPISAYQERPEWQGNPQAYSQKLTEMLCHRGHLYLDEQPEDRPFDLTGEERHRDHFAEEQFEVPSDLYIAEIPADVDSFRETINFATTLETPVPAVQIGTWLLPVDILSSIQRNPTARRAYSRDLQKRNGNVLIDLILEELWQGGLEFERLAPRDAVSTFWGNLSNFLYKRVLALGKGGSAGGDKEPPDGGYSNVVEFSVFSKTNGLTVLYDPVYLFRQGLVFGSPTSPVTAPIHPGLYVFGITGPGGKPQWDHSLYEIPGPTNHATLYL